MLTSQNKKYLRKLGMEYRSLFQIGKDGLSDNLMDTLSDSLEAHELVKCNLLKTCPVDVREAAIECASATGSEVVHIVGHTSRFPNDYAHAVQVAPYAAFPP